MLGPHKLPLLVVVIDDSFDCFGSTNNFFAAAVALSEALVAAALEVASRNSYLDLKIATCKNE